MLWAGEAGAPHCVNAVAFTSCTPRDGPRRGSLTAELVDSRARWRVAREETSNARVSACATLPLARPGAPGATGSPAQERAGRRGSRNSYAKHEFLDARLDGVLPGAAAISAAICTASSTTPTATPGTTTPNKVTRGDDDRGGDDEQRHAETGPDDAPLLDAQFIHGVHSPHPHAGLHHGDQQRIGEQPPRAVAAPHEPRPAARPRRAAANRCRAAPWRSRRGPTSAGRAGCDPPARAAARARRGGERRALTSTVSHTSASSLNLAAPTRRAALRSVRRPSTRRSRRRA